MRMRSYWTFWVVTIAELSKRLHQKYMSCKNHVTKQLINLSYQALQTSSRMAEIHDQFDTILILDFGSQVFHPDGSNCHIDKLQQ